MKILNWISMVLLRGSATTSPTASREAHSALGTALILVGSLVAISALLPERASLDWLRVWSERIGWSWPFFYAFVAYLVWTISAIVVERTTDEAPRTWDGQHTVLLWIFECAPTLGMLTSFTSLAQALVRLSAAEGTGDAAVKAFLSDFGVCITSTIVGGGISLVAFTLVKFLPDEPEFEEAGNADSLSGEETARQLALSPSLQSES